MPGTVKKLQFSEGTDVGAPTDLSLQTSTSVIKEYANDAAYLVDQPFAEGGVYLNSTTNKFRYYTNGAWRNAVPESDSASPTKTFLVDVSGNTAGISATIKFLASANRIYTFPNGTGNDDVVLRTITQILTNKELTSALLELPIVKGTVKSIDVDTAADFAIGASVGAHNVTIGGASSTIIIPGNFTVNGTTTFINSTDLQVVDQNITVNKGGNDASAQGAGLTVKRTTTDGTFLFDSALASKWKAGLAGSEIELANVSSNQTFTNKRLHLHTTVAANDSTSPRIVLPQNTFANLSTISGANHPNEGATYWATDVKKAYIWDGSALVPLGSGSGSGEINYVTNSDAETNTSNVSVYADAAGTSPVDGTGGSPTVTVTRNTTTPLRGNADFKLAKTAVNSQGQGWAWDLNTVALPDKSKKLKIQFDYNFTDANYVSGDVLAFIYDITNATVITPQNNSLEKSSGTFTCTFDSTTSASYRLILHVATTNATAYNIFVDTVIVGPGVIAKGAAVGEWISYPLTIGAITSAPTKGTIVTDSARWRRVGDSMELRYDFRQSAAGSAGSGAYLFPLPAGYTIDTTKLTPSTNRLVSPLVGHAFEFADNGGGGTVHTGNIRAYDTSNVWVADEAIATTGDNAMNWSSTDNGRLSLAGMTYSMRWTVPISQWSGSGTVNVSQNDVEYAYNTAALTAAGASDTTAFATGPAGAVIGSINSATSNSFTTMRCRFQTIQSNDEFIIQVSADGLKWMDIGQVDAINTATMSTSQYGISYRVVNTTDIDVFFGNQGRLAGNATYAGSGVAWSGIGTWKWRVKKFTGGAAVGFGEASTGSMGLMRPGQIVGIADSTLAAAGRVGEVMTATSSSNPNTGGTLMASLALTAGRWRLKSNTVYAANSTSRLLEACISLVSGTFTGVNVNTNNYNVGYFNLADGIGAVQITDYIVYIPAGTTVTYYLNAQVSTTTGVTSTRNFLQAERI